MTEWYEQSFGEDYLLVYKHRDVQGAKQEVGKMIGWLDLKQGTSVLDLCCGMGRHAVALKDAGYRVTGIDLSEVLLREARKNDYGHQIVWIRGDMRKLPFEAEQFDAIVNLFTSFGYFEADEENLQVLREAERVLKPGGSFVIDILNPAYTAEHLVPESVRTDEGQRIRENRKIERGFVIKEIEITGEAEGEGQGPRRYMERIKLYALDPFKGMLAKAGLTLDAVYGDYEESKYDAKASPRMILVGRKAVL